MAKCVLGVLLLIIDGLLSNPQTTPQGN